MLPSTRASELESRLQRGKSRDFPFLLVSAQGAPQKVWSCFLGVMLSQGTSGLKSQLGRLQGDAGVL